MVEKEEKEKLWDDYKQTASEAKQTLITLKRKINDKFQIKGKGKKSKEWGLEWGRKKRIKIQNYKNKNQF